MIVGMDKVGQTMQPVWRENVLSNKSVVESVVALGVGPTPKSRRGDRSEQLSSNSH